MTITVLSPLTNNQYTMKYTNCPLKKIFIIIIIKIITIKIKKIITIILNLLENVTINIKKKEKKIFNNKNNKKH